MACQAVVAFVSELAQVAFLALPRAVVAIAGSQWPVCRGLFGPGVYCLLCRLCFGTPGELSCTALGVLPPMLPCPTQSDA